jgi:membrane-associated phospholipid phosphatase
MPRTLWLPVLLVLAFVGQAAAAEATFLTPGHPDLTKLLPAPPAPSSKEQYGDLAGILAIQKTRTKAQTDRALADDTAGTFGFADVLGSSFTAERLPKVAALFEKIRGDAVVVANAGKDTWNRPRPYDVSTAVEPVGEKPSGSSYPSTSSVVGYLTAIMLANMVPEKSAALFARTRIRGRQGHSRRAFPDRHRSRPSGRDGDRRGAVGECGPPDRVCRSESGAAANAGALECDRFRLDRIAL